MFSVILWLHTLFFLYQYSYYQMRIKVTICETDSIMILKCELCPQSYLTGLSKNCQKSVFSAHIYTKWLYSRDLPFSSNFNFTIFSLILLLLFPNVFTSILKIYELLKKYYKIPYCQMFVLTLIIYQVKSVPNSWLLKYTPINFVEDMRYDVKESFSAN